MTRQGGIAARFHGEVGGFRLEVAFEAMDEKTTLPLFRPAKGA